ncbi:MAG: DUF6273 domain-containing protein [Synergistes sp.]|nr:DUF6273 domain-containing protein [Synergistes sp.]
MSIFKCKMCGGTIEFEPGATVGVCDSCGTKQTLPRLDDDRRVNLYDRANHFRRNNEFDKAAGIYEQILTEDTADAEAYWSLVLCRYGIEYVEDPATRKRVPTVNRAQFTSIFDDDNYKSALRYADASQSSIYEAEAAAINEIQKGILAISQKEEPFDVFICYKETVNDGRRTQNSVLANDLYHQLTQEGFKVFFSRITLEDKLGTAYEPYIFAALNSAKVMVVLGTRPEHFNAVWVKNEWSRYLALVKQSGGKKVLIPAYKDMDPYDLPEEFSHLQAQDMSKLGFMQDLIRGIKKITAADGPVTTVREAAVTGVNANVAPLLERVFLFLEDGKWQDANIYCEKVLDIDPKNAEAYLGKLMAELRVGSRKQLADHDEPFDGSENYAKVIRFGDEKLETEMRGYIDYINERNENARLTGIYDSAVSAMDAAKSEAAYKLAAETFRTIPGFKDADELAEQCLKDAVYASGKSQMITNSVSGYERAIKTFSTISGWKDTDEQISACQRKIEEIKANQEAARLARQRQEEQLRIAAERAAKKRKKIATITAIIIAACAVCIAMAIVLTKVIIPNARYNSALKLYEDDRYSEALTAFEALNGYKDSKEQIKRCKNEIQYENAISLANAGKYDEALKEFKGLNGYKDSKDQISKCETAIKDQKYENAVSLANAGKYDEALEEFKALKGYKDSFEKAAECLFLKQKQGLTDITVGATVKFGWYEQDNQSSNGKEEIEWIVLAKDGNNALVISKYALDCQQYNTSDTSVTWETCTLRTWLNGTFYTEVFGSEHQNMILNSTVSADENPSHSTPPGNNTTDKVFLLSITEANKYFSSDSDRQCEGTKYCYAQGARSGGNGNCWWWLRSPGDDSSLAAFVYDVGSVYNRGNYVDSRNNAVRPALWIDIGS